MSDITSTNNKILLQSSILRAIPSETLYLIENLSGHSKKNSSFKDNKEYQKLNLKKKKREYFRNNNYYQ